MSDWERTLDGAAPYVALTGIVNRLVEQTLDRFREQLLADPEVTTEMRAAMIAKSRPIIAAQIREDIEGAWTTLQLEQQPTKPM